MHIFTVSMVSEQCLIPNSIWGIMVLLNERKRSRDEITTKRHLSISYTLDKSLQILEKKSLLRDLSCRKPSRRTKIGKEGK